MTRAFALLALLIASIAADEGPVQDLLTRLLGAQQAVTSVAGTFVQRNLRADDPDGTASVHEATFALQVPDKYNLVYTKPGDDEWRLRYCSDGVLRREITQMFAGQDPDVITTPVKAAGGGANGEGGDGADIGRYISTFLRFDPAEVNKDFVVTIATAGDGFRLDLLPRGADLARQVKSVAVELDGGFRTREIRFDDPQGNRVVVSVVTSEYNGTIPAGMFTYTPGK
jgi:hypothetical protein